MNKDFARKVFLDKRKSFTEDKVKLTSEDIVNQIREMPEYISAKKVGIYYPINNEINLLELMNDSKTFLFPRVEGKNIVFARAKSITEMKKSSLNILEPVGDSEEAIDVLFVPMMGYTKNGYRIGYGGGYYDRFLKTFKGISFGVSYKELFMKDIEIADYDYPLKKIIVEENKWHQLLFLPREMDQGLT